MAGIPIPSNHRALSAFSDPSLDMQSPYYPDSYSSYSSSPGGMDFFFYGSQPVYDSLCDLDPMSPFPMQEVAAPDVYNITSSPYYQPTHEFPVFERQTMPQSASSCASSCASNSFNFPGEEIALPSYPVSVSGFEYESGSDSPAPASKPAKPFGCDDCGKAFTRFADLKRHQSSVHYPVFRNCPVDHCSRKGSNGFPRQDHLVEHLRSYHHMNVPKRGGCKRAAKEIS